MYCLGAERLRRVLRVLEVWSSNLGPTKSYIALQTVRHRFNYFESYSSQWSFARR